jgi:uncharacterized membrane protein
MIMVAWVGFFISVVLILWAIPSAFDYVNNKIASSKDKRWRIACVLLCVAAVLSVVLFCVSELYLMTSGYNSLVGR